MEAVKTISPQEAWQLLPDWKLNPNFVTEVRKLVLGGICRDGGNSGVPVLLICRSGKRSLEAGIALINEGFSDIYNISEGFEGELDEHHHRSTLGGWRNVGLPWEQC
jgi:rhodanese-related sulfurtransferase